jgi:REP element-mobilizing transposase RayT
MPLHHRRSIRLVDHDYASPAAYFVTVCTRDRQNLFGCIEGSVMTLSEYGEIVSDTWRWLEGQFAGIVLDEWVVMPNHLHGIIVRREGEVEAASRESSTMAASPTALTQANPRTLAMGSPAPVAGPRPKPLGGLIGAFKTVTTRRINDLRQSPGARVWQRNYWEHIVRDDVDLIRIRAYIVGNVANWATDSLNVDARG